MAVVAVRGWRCQSGTISRRNPVGFQGEAAQPDGEGLRQTVRQWLSNRSAVYLRGGFEIEQKILL